VAERIAKLIAEGKTTEEISAAKPTADFDEKWGKGFIKPETFTPMVAHNILKNR
jgi:hypothetical protein